MDNEVFAGNCEEVGAANGGWIVGHFKDLSILKSTDLEVKWDVLKADTKNESFAAQIEGKTISILVRGEMFYRFRTKDGQVVDKFLKKEGDFLIWEPQVYHFWRAMQDSLVVTVRWPSKSGDVIREPA